MRLLLLLFVISSHAVVAVAAAPKSAQLASADSLKALRLPAGYEAQIVAAEPLVLDPVAFDWISPPN
jgi:hypothetical protein